MQPADSELGGMYVLVAARGFLLSVLSTARTMRFGLRKGSFAGSL